MSIEIKSTVTIKIDGVDHVMTNAAAIDLWVKLGFILNLKPPVATPGTPVPLQPHVPSLWNTQFKEINPLFQYPVTCDTTSKAMIC
jgi:hypothetical protein